MKTKSKIGGYILRSGGAALLVLCGVVAISWAINPKSSTSQNTAAFGVNGHGNSPSDCMPNDYTITTGSGTIVPGTTDTDNHCDDCITLIGLPFPVTFYDQTFFSVGISSNGNLQFTGANVTDFNNFCLPTLGMTDVIAPYWDDLCDEDGANGQGVFTSVSGTSPNRIFSIEFRENLSSPCVTGPPALDFEVRLHEDTPNFEIIYGALNGNTGASATVGAQRDTGSHSTQFECNTACNLTSFMLPDAPRPRLHQRRRHSPFRAIPMSRRLALAASFLVPPTQATIAMIAPPLLRSHFRLPFTDTPLPLRT